MSNILAVLTNLDPLAILFLVGSLAFLWATVHVLVNDLDLEKPEAGREPSAPDEAATTRGAVAAAPPPEPPSRPTGAGGRKAA